MKTRPSYDQVDDEGRWALFSARDDSIKNSWIHELWMKVIIVAIEDISYCEILRREGEKPSEQQLKEEITARQFLFDDEYFIPLDDYCIDVHCNKCGGIWTEFISILAGNRVTCPECNASVSWKHIEYIISEREFKTINLRELLSLFDIENITAFREGILKRIDTIAEKKLKHRRKRREKNK